MEGIFMVKKRLFVVCVLLCLLLAGGIAKTVELSSLKYTFEVPDGYSTDSTYIASRYQYFAAHHPQDTIVLTVTSTPNSGRGFESMSSKEIQKLEQETKNQYKAYGISVLSFSKYSANGITYLNIEIKASLGYQIQYATIKGGRMNGFTFTFKSAPTSAEKDEVLKIVKSIKNM